MDEILSGFEILVDEVFVVLDIIIGLDVLTEAVEFETFKILVVLDTLELEDVFDVLVEVFEGKVEFDLFEDVGTFEGVEITIELLEIFVEL